MEPNLLFYGDNLDVLRRHVRDDSVDLVYLDPPFNSNADYNVLFSEHGVKARKPRPPSPTRPARPRCSSSSTSSTR